MYVYKMLLLNRLREYRCLIQNMLVPFCSLLIALVLISYHTVVLSLPVIKAIEQMNPKALFYIHLLLICNYYYCCFVKVRPILIVKPMTLYLFEPKDIKNQLCFKMLGKIIKHLIIAFVLTLCVNGLNYNNEFFSIQISLFCLLENTALLSWQIYHNQCKKLLLLKKTLWLIICITVLLSNFTPYMALFNLILWFCLLIHSLFILDLNRPKYDAEMMFIEKLSAAQNHNNTALLSSYMEEQKLSSITNRKIPINKNFISKYPLTWKAKTSILRLCKDKIIIGIVIFAITFLIYKIPVFWSLPFLEQDGIRYSLLLFGMLAVFQITMQSMLQQLGSIAEKAKNGLFLPLSDKEIIMQFTVIPIIVMIFVLGNAAIALKSGFVQFIVSAGVLSLITCILFYLELKRKDLLAQYYFVITILILIISFLLSYR